MGGTPRCWSELVDCTHEFRLLWKQGSNNLTQQFRAGWTDYCSVLHLCHNRMIRPSTQIFIDQVAELRTCPILDIPNGSF